MPALILTIGAVALNAVSLNKRTAEMEMAPTLFIIGYMHRGGCPADRHTGNVMRFLLQNRISLTSPARVAFERGVRDGDCDIPE